MQQNTPFINLVSSLHLQHAPIVCLGFFVGLGALLFSVPAFANDCYGLFRQQKFVLASKCFEKQAKEIGNQPTGTNKLKKGRLLRNAALSLDREAKRSGSSKAAQHRSKAIELLGIYLKQNLCDSSETCNATKKMLTKFRKQIGYANVTLVTNHPKAVACLTANGFKKCSKGSLWKSKLLPKTYQVQVTYPSTPPTVKTKTFTAISRMRKMLLFTPPVKKIGMLSVVTSDPRATILLKGKKLKGLLTHTGALWTKKLPAGAYKVTVVYPNLAPLNRTVKIVTGKAEAAVFSKPSPPVLIINTTPINAQVFVNGAYKGNTGIRLRLNPGKSKIEIKRGCYEPITKMVILKANKETYISVILKRDPVYLDWSNKKNSRGSAALGWVTLIGGVALAGAGGAMYGLASGKHTEAQEVRPSNFDKYKTLAGENNTFVTMGHVGTGLGVLGIGVGVAALLMSRPQSRFSLSCKVKLKDEK